MERAETKLVLTQPRGMSGVRGMVVPSGMERRVLRSESRMRDEQVAMFRSKLVHSR